MYFNDQKKDTNIDNDLIKSKYFNNKIVKGTLKFVSNLSHYLRNLFKNKFFKYSFISFGIVVFLLIIYFSFIYNPIKYYLVLNGDTDITLYKGMDYYEPGYVAYDSKNNNYDDSVVTYGSVDPNTVGEYILTYEFNDIYVTRIVTVLESDNEHRTYLVLKGDEFYYHQKGSEFIDPGVEVIDSTDYNLRDQVVKEGYVDVNTSGTYVIKYSVTNSIGVTLSTERVVIVLGLEDVSVNYNDEFTNGNVIVNVGMFSSLYDYMILPDGSISSESFSSFEVSENGLYRIEIHGTNDKIQKKDVYIGNIDRNNPEGSCDGYYKDGKSYVTVYASDDYSGVSRIVFGDQVFNQSNIVMDREYSNPTFYVYDKAGNHVNVSCKLQNKNTIASNNFVKCVDSTIYKGKTYSLSVAQKKKLAAMAYNEDGYSNAGLRAVISHMANLYEYQVWSGAIKSSTSMYDYITTTKWYAAGTRKRQYNDKTMAKILPMIDDILGRGNRTIPLYVNNFDLFPNDIVNPVNISNYKQGITLYDNIYGAKNHKFWCFSLNSKHTSGNLYGYGSEKYKNYISN